MTDLWTYLKSAGKPIFLYGTGNGADKILNELKHREIQVTGVFASGDFIRDRYFRDFKVTGFEQALSYGNIITLVSFGTQLDNVINEIKRISGLCETYVPDVPVVNEDTVFDLKYARLHEENIIKAYSLLADDYSKKVFEDIVMFKLTGNPELLFQCESSKSEIYKLINFGKKEIYFDIGAYNGDTVVEFASIAEDYKKIIAAEPDIKSFRKLSVNTAKMHDIELHNVAISNVTGEIGFSALGGRNSYVSLSKERIHCETVDNLLSGSPVTYIKFDIEGQEANAVKGAANTIKIFKPKINIAAYHRNEDIFSLPLLLNSINSEYKIYFRHHPYIPAWDTNYYLV